MGPYVMTKTLKGEKIWRDSAAETKRHSKVRCQWSPPKHFTNFLRVP